MPHVYWGIISAWALKKSSLTDTFCKPRPYIKNRIGLFLLKEFSAGIFRMDNIPNSQRIFLITV